MRLELRRRILVAVTAGLVGTSVSSLAQQSSSAPRVGLLWLGSPETAHLKKALLEGLSASGFAEGRNVLIEDATSVKGYDQLGEAAGRLVRRGVNVIVAYGGTATRAARNATAAIPIVMITGIDPVKQGFVASLSHPGGNITGVTTLGGEVSSKRVQLLKEAVPQLHHVAIMLNPGSAVEGAALLTAQNAVRSLGLQSYVAEARSETDFVTTFAKMARAKVDGVLVLGSTSFFARRVQIVALAAQHHLPSIAVQREYAEAGALLSYGPDFPYTFKQAGEQTARILKGVSPAELPFEQVSKLELVVNLKTARDLGIALPQSLLLRADTVIE